MRFIISTSTAFIVTLTLFYLMQYMISGSGKQIKKPNSYGVVGFVRLQRETVNAKSQPPKPIPPRNTLQPLDIPPSFEMNLATLQPPTVAMQKGFEGEPLETMQLGKPYLGPLTALVSKSMTSKKPLTTSKITSASKPTPLYKTEKKSVRLARTSLVDKMNPKSAQASLGKQQMIGSAIAPNGAISALQGDVGDYEDEAVPVYKMAPKYPRKAAKSRIEGWVKVEFTITAKGAVTDAVVVDSRPRRTFDRSAVQSVRKWRFKPKIVDGRPVQRKASQVIEFKLAKG